jgi:hypothetical protein
MRTHSHVGILYIYMNVRIQCAMHTSDDPPVWTVDDHRIYPRFVACAAVFLSSHAIDLVIPNITVIFRIAHNSV